MKNKLLTIDEFYNTVGDYFKNRHGCDDSDVKVILEDFKDPYASYHIPYLRVEPEGKETIDGKKYRTERHWLDFTMFQTFENKHPFEYIVYYQMDDDKHGVDDYAKADKLFEILQK